MKNSFFLFRGCGVPPPLPLMSGACPLETKWGYPGNLRAPARPPEYSLLVHSGTRLPTEGESPGESPNTPFIAKRAFLRSLGENARHQKEKRVCNHVQK